MLLSKKTIILYILGSVLLAMVCSGLAYSFTVQSYQAKNTGLKGTYQFDIRNVSNPEYLAVYEASEADADDSEGGFQWYNASGEMLKRGICKFDKEDFVTFYVDNHIIGTLVFTNDKYYFINESLEYQEVSKVSVEPIVSSIE